MKRYLLVITLTVMLCGTASAQSEFLNGYIIKKDGTFTYGLIKYIAKDYTVNECVFKWFDISSEYVFLPGDIEVIRIHPRHEVQYCHEQRKEDFHGMP